VLNGKIPTQMGLKKIEVWASRNLMKFSFSGDIQDPPGQGPVQPALGDPASAGGSD